MSTRRSSGWQPCQTLSRLNRIHPLKDQTFVLDFRNETHTIVDAFEQFHGVTVAPPTDPNILYDTRAQLDQHDVLREDEFAAAMPALLDPSGSQEQRSAKAYAVLGPARQRFEGLPAEERLEFRDTLTRFVRTYGFVSQIAAFTDPRLERDYVFCRALALYLRTASTVERLDLGTEVELTHLRHQLTHEGSLALQSERSEIKSFFGTGQGAQQEFQLETLSSIVDQLNERFGTDFTDADKLLFDQFEAEWIADGELSDQAQSNTIENVALAFEKKFMSTIVTRMDANSDIFKKMLDDDEFSDFVKAIYLKKVYDQLRDVA